MRKQYNPIDFISAIENVIWNFYRDPNLWQSAVFVDGTAVRMTRKSYRGKIPKSGPFEAVLTIGRPNFYERERLAKDPNLIQTFRSHPKRRK